MISIERQRNALRAINAVMVGARKLARDGKAGELASALDVAEYLPLLMLDPDDRTAEFRRQLQDLAQVEPMFILALDRFDEGEAGEMPRESVVVEFLLDSPKQVTLVGGLRVRIAAEAPDGSEATLVLQRPGGDDLVLPHAIDIGEHHLVPRIYCIQLGWALGTVLVGGEIVYVLGVDGAVIREFRLHREERWVEYWHTKFVTPSPTVHTGQCTS